MALFESRRIVTLGTAFHGSTTVQRLHAMGQLGHQVTFVPIDYAPDRAKSFYHRARFRLGIPCELGNENERLIKTVAATKPELIWIDKGLTIRPGTLKQIKRQNPTATIASFSLDDMMNPRNQSVYWKQAFRLYDVHITTKTFNIEEFIKLGARAIVFMANSYAPEVHRPMEISSKDRERFRSEVAFIGYYERERYKSLRALAEQGISVRVWGDGWRSVLSPTPNLKLEKQPLFGEDYVKAINAAKIVLCFLRKANRDRQTTRSVEIPACGAFMLGERTEEHENLFREGLEADYFSSDGELVAKAHQYLHDDVTRQRIARAGRQRCLEGHFSYAERMAVVIDECLSRTFPMRRLVPSSEVGRVY